MDTKNPATDHEELPMQLVVIDLKNGRRGLFIGAPLIPEEDMNIESEGSYIENIWFSNIQSLPPSHTLEQLIQMAMTQVEAPTLQ